MLSVLSLLLVTMALSIVMLLVLSSLSSSKVKGIKEWSAANRLAVAALFMFAGRGVLHDIVSIELANTVFMAAITMMFVGFRRHLGLTVPGRTLVAGMIVVLAVLVVFHFGLNSIAWRTVAVSIYHGSVCLAMGITVGRAATTSHSRYPCRFTFVAALALAAGHWLRGLVYAIEAWTSTPLFDPSTLNLVFFAIGTLALPTLTLGAVMMANAEIISMATYAADHDHLTGAWSRRGFFTMAEREHARAARGGALSVLLFDIDHFKKINDTYGHAIGDEVLKDIVLCTETVVRSVDICARLGGEEFVVLLPDANAETALIVGRRLRSALERTVHISTSHIDVAYTASIGIATLEQNESLASLVSRADAALYAAKSAGRNTAVSAVSGVQNTLLSPA